jgi:hypothetical protein
MKRFSFSLLKYITLLLAVILAGSNLLYGAPAGSTFFFAEFIFGLLYFAFSISEFSGNLDRIDPSYERFYYLPYRIITFKLIRIGALAVAAAVLYMSKSSLIVLSGLLFLIIFLDALVFLLRLQKHDYFISLFANYVFFVLEGERKLFASQISVIEYRYGIFYLRLRNNTMAVIDTSRIPKGKRNHFIEKFVLWVVCNNLHFTDEAREKLADIIADAI